MAQLKKKKQCTVVCRKIGKSHILKHAETKPNESKQDRETTQQRCTT